MDPERRRPLNKTPENSVPNNGCKTRYGLVAILISVGLERMSFYGLLANLVLFLNSEPFMWHSYNALLASFYFMGISYLSSFIGGLVADTCLGRFKTLVISFVVYVAGYSFMPYLAYSSFHDGQDSLNETVPLFCYPKDTNVNNLNTLDPFHESCAANIFSFLTIIAIASGFYRANIAIFGGDQSRIYGNTTTFFNLFYFSINFGTLISMIVITWLQQDLYFFVGYLVSISALVLSFIIFISGSCVYVYRQRSNRIIRNTWRIIKEAFQKRNRSHPQRGYITTDESSSISGGSEYTELSSPQCCLDYAKFRYGGSFTDSQVNDVKKLFKIICVFLVMSPYWLVYFQTQTTFLLQGLHMNLNTSAKVTPPTCNSTHSHHGNKYLQPQNTTIITESDKRKEIVAAWLTIFDVLFVILLIPVVEKVYRRFERRGRPITMVKRMVVGMMFAVISMVTAGVLEYFRLKKIYPCDHGDYKSCVNATVPQSIGNSTYYAADLSIFLQIPQYALIGVSEVFASIAGLDFAYQMAPRSMKGIIMGLYYFFSGLGSFLGIVIMSLFQNKWFFGEDHGNINCRVGCNADGSGTPTHQCHLDYFFFFLAGFQAVGLIVFLLVVRKLKITQELEAMKELRDSQHNQHPPLNSSVYSEHERVISPNNSTYGRTGVIAPGNSFGHAGVITPDTSISGRMGVISPDHRTSQIPSTIQRPHTNDNSYYT